MKALWMSLLVALAACGTPEQQAQTAAAAEPVKEEEPCTLVRDDGENQVWSCLFEYEPPQASLRCEVYAQGEYMFGMGHCDEITPEEQ